jgi:hypothetical protein
MVAGDFNGDSIPDVAVSDTHSIQILTGVGDGGFVEGESIQVVSSSMEVLLLAASDLNSDGRVDLAIDTEGTGLANLGILQGNGDGTFQPQVVLDAGTGVVALGVADFNSDGRPDLCVVTKTDVDSLGREVGILLNCSQ